MTLKTSYHSLLLLLALGTCFGQASHNESRVYWVTASGYINPYTGACYDIPNHEYGTMHVCMLPGYQLFSFDGVNYFAMETSGKVMPAVLIPADPSFRIKEFKYGVH